MTERVAASSEENAVPPSRRPSPRDLLRSILFVLVGLLNLVDPGRNPRLRFALGAAATMVGGAGVVAYLRHYWRWRKNGSFLSEDERPRPSLW